MRSLGCAFFVLYRETVNKSAVETNATETAVSNYVLEEEIMENNNQGNKFQRLFNFNNVGAKIKSFTKWYCWVSIIIIWVAAVIGFFAGFADDDTIFITFISIVAAAVMPFIIWVSSWMMYGFGELIERAINIDLNTRGESAKSETQAKIDDERIQKLERLRSQGLITEEEYQQALNK